LFFCYRLLAGVLGIIEHEVAVSAAAILITSVGLLKAALSELSDAALGLSFLINI
jgi:hypothetical protein